MHPRIHEQVKNPQCEKCQAKEGAMCYYHTTLLCGNCLIDVMKKDNERRRAMILGRAD